MDAPAPAPVPAAPAPPQQPFKAAWPPSAQLALAFLIGVVTTLLLVNGWGYLRWGTRPAELERGIGLSYRIDLNGADHVELLQLPGVGENLARKIEAYREEHGGFREVNELIQVHGVGPATLERLRPWVVIKTRAGNDLAEEADAVPAAQSRTTEAPRSGKKSTSKKTLGQKEAALSQPIDVNRATAAELQRLPGIGPKTAQLILDERDKARFKSIDDLRRVRGIGPKKLESIRPYIKVGRDSIHVAAVDDETEAGAER
jgi:competence protein ComEA